MLWFEDTLFKRISTRIRQRIRIAYLVEISFKTCHFNQINWTHWEIRLISEVEFAFKKHCSYQRKQHIAKKTQQQNQNKEDWPDYYSAKNKLH